MPVDERLLLPKEKPWNVDPGAQSRPDVKPEPRGPLERERRLITVNVSQVFAKLARWWRR